MTFLTIDCGIKHTSVNKEWSAIYEAVKMGKMLRGLVWVFLLYHYLNLSSTIPWCSIDKIQGSRTDGEKLHFHFHWLLHEVYIFSYYEHDNNTVVLSVTLSLIEIIYICIAHFCWHFRILFTLINSSKLRLVARIATISR